MVGLDPVKYGEHFYELYTNNTRRKLHNDRKSLSKRRIKDKKAAGAVAGAIDGNGGAILNPMETPLIKDQMLMLPILPVAHIELEANASKFAVFAAIRLTVLEAEARYAIFQDVSNNLKKPLNMSNSCCLVCAGTCLISNPVDCSCHTLATAASILGKRELQDSLNSDGADSETDELTEKETPIAHVPLLVGAGLRSLFELIADARHIQPTLCTKALKALLDVIQGQQPESFKAEPEELIEPLYDLLLDLATMTAADPPNITAETNWSAMACAALLGLVLARGDTGKTLKAITAMLMSPKQLSSQLIQLPAVLSALQRTTLAAAFNKPTRPDYHTHGVPRNSMIDEFRLSAAKLTGNFYSQPAMASDGIYLYLLVGSTLFKIGSGFGGSYKGHIYKQNDDFTKETSGWLGFCNNQLYFRRSTKHTADHLHIVSTDTLMIKSVVPVNTVQCGSNYALFTDEDSMNAICTNREDSLVIKKLNIYNPNASNETSCSELPLQMARKKFRTLGYAAFEDEVLNQNQVQKIQSSYNLFEPKLPCEGVEVASIVCGKEFGLVRGSNGKIFYYGKAASLGLKSIARTPTMKLAELIICKSANIIHIACGHDGIHALLVNDDGSIYFTGTARRGEDGDTSKNRRQPKAIKPKKMSKMEGHVIVHAACNNGTSAFVTKTGKLIMFGKDTTHCDSAGFVTGIAEQHIVKVALGKAHCVALNTKGQIFTFGLNNKGQCGRAFVKSKDVTAAASINFKSQMPASNSLKYDFSNLCDYDDHNLVQGNCRVCVVCRECTGYNMSCVSSLNLPIEERIAGAICPCGHGCSGCAHCGICSTCIATQESENDDGKDTKTLQSELNRQRVKGLIIRRKDKQRPAINEEQIQYAEFEKDPPRVAPLPPQMLQFPPNCKSSPVVQIACGLHHTVVLTLAGDVFTFGSNQYGQLGTGDLQPVYTPVKVNVSGSVCQVAAGSNHTVLLTTKGVVYTFGSFQKGQLGRNMPNDFHYEKSANTTHAGSGFVDMSASNMSRTAESNSKMSTKDSSIAGILAQRQKFLWHCSPGCVFGLGASYGKKATWIGASGDQTFIKIDESLITTQMLSKINVVANKKTILLIPNIPLNFDVLTVNRRDGNCMPHALGQVRFSDIAQMPKPKVDLSEINQNFTPHRNEQQRQQQPKPHQQNAKMPASSYDQMSCSMHEARNQIFDLQHQNANSGSGGGGSGSGSSQRRRQRHRQVDFADKSASGSVLEANHPDRTHFQIAFALDPLYNVLWVFKGGAGKVQCYNVLASELNEPSIHAFNYRAILKPALTLPCINNNALVSRSQAALNLLACLDVLTSAQDNIPNCFEESLPKQQNQRSKESQDHAYQTVNRFDNFGGGWGYSGHSVEAIRFSTDTDVVIYGFGMFGGRGEYTCKLKLFDLGHDGGTYEKDGVLLAETKDVPYECAARSKHHIMLPKTVNAIAGRWYLVWARIAGPSSDCGSCGQSTVTTEDQVVFTFKSSKKANNGTDINSGQIPSILYRLITQESKQPAPPVDADPVPKISKSFAFCVSKECFESLVLLLSWSWETFKVNLRELREKSRYLSVKQSLEYLIIVNRCCLRLLRKYINEIYPHQYVSSNLAMNNAATASSIAAALTKLHTRLGRTPTDGKDKHTKAVSNAVSTVIAKYFGEASSSTATTVAAGVSPTTTARKPNAENIQLAECIGNVRALLINIFCDDLSKNVRGEEGFEFVREILEECHESFVACFDAFYPTSSLKWNCLCDLLTQMDKGMLHTRLLSAILAGLCCPTVKLRATFSLFNGTNERQSIISPSDNSGLPMLSSTEGHQYPILVEQMIYRTQQEKSDFLSNTWNFKDVLVRLLDIISNPIKARIEGIYNRTIQYSSWTGKSKDLNQGLVDNCCHLLARVLAEIVYHTTQDYDKMFLPPRSLHSTGSRFARCDLNRTWNTGNFGPDAIAFSVDRPGIAIAGALVFSGSGSYDYQLELLYDNTVDLQSQHKWETMESTSGSYDQDSVHNDMVEIKFERPVHIKENSRYALRLCSQGARTCSGDAGVASLRGPCGTIFNFYACDLSFNGTTPQRGQIPCVLYYSTPLKNDSSNACFPGSNCSPYMITEVTARDTALQIIMAITKKCTELLVMARNALAASISPSDNSSSNHTQTIDSEHNITPIEEHMDVNWANNSRTASLPPVVDPNLSTARDITKRIESFSKGLMETLKFEKRSTNPFEMEIEVGATEIEEAVVDLNLHNGSDMAKLNGNERIEEEVAEDLLNAQHQYQQQQHQHQLFNLAHSDSEEVAAQAISITPAQILEVFNLNSSGMFHTLLPLVYAYVANLAYSDAKSSVQILGLIKEILPHVAALNQLNSEKRNEQLNNVADIRTSAAAAVSASAVIKSNEHCAEENNESNCTTSNHYCIVESEHPYRSATVNCYRVEFPTCVQWLTLEFDPQCGTAQLEDYLLISIPLRATSITENSSHFNNLFNEELNKDISKRQQNLRSSNNSSNSKNTKVFLNCCDRKSTHFKETNAMLHDETALDWVVVKKFNTSSNWIQNVMILPGNCVEFSLETASQYAQDANQNKFGFKCLVVGYDNPATLSPTKSSLIHLEQELAYLGGMCSANLMKKELCLPDDKEFEDITGVEDTINTHHALLSKGFALSEPTLTVHQALETFLPIGSQSNERQFLKDFISGAPGSSGARLAAWLQPEPRLDPNKCELNTITETLRYGWPTQITVTIRDQYGDSVLVPELKVEIKAIPTGSSGNGNIKLRRASYADSAATYGGLPPPPRITYEPTIKDKMCFKAITFMKSLSNYSFEELRFSSPVQTRVTETLYAQDLKDGTFSVHWTPNSVGNYCLTVTIDGILLEEVYRVEVKEGGLPPPLHTQSITKPQPPNKLRRFFTKNTAGLRIRSHPTLQSEQVGILKLNGIISFIDEIENDDGTWLRLSTESIRQHCTMGWYPTEAWCLQYNQHLGKTLLHPVTEAATSTSNNTSPTQARQQALLENIQSPVSPVPLDSPEKAPTTCSPTNQKMFEFSQTSCLASTQSRSSEMHTSSTNPFTFPQKMESSETSKDEVSQSLDSQRSVEDSEGRPIVNLNQQHHTSPGSSSEMHTSPSNLSTAIIAGVVGGGASKLQALQKWFKGDTIDDNCVPINREREHQRKRSDVSEMASASVRELVRAMSGQDAVKQQGETNKAEAPMSDFEVSTIRATNFTASQTAALLSTPKHSPRKFAGSKLKSNVTTATALANTAQTAKDTTFANLDEEEGMLQITSSSRNGTAQSTADEVITIGEAKTASTTGSSDISSPPVWPFSKSEPNVKLPSKPPPIAIGPIKRAMPPSLAESIRAVFAAFLWHEGIVHDAMACASFLKFHPNMPKEGATVVTRREHDSNTQLSKEQKAQQRHSVEVANAGNYLNIRPSTLETLTKSGNSSINNRKYRKNLGNTEEQQKLLLLPEIVTVLPPALRCLVYLWEQICTNCIQIVQTNTLEKEKTVASTPPAGEGNHVSDAKEKSVDALEKESICKRSKRKKKDDGSWCEICEMFLPIPVTYHMRIVHPGCGKSAKGKGYNSVGIFCEGWAGNCGEGGKGASSWFLMCDTCREKYMSTNKNTNNVNHSTEVTTSGNDIHLFGVKSSQSIIANSEIYTTMRENANFLLELSSSNASMPTEDAAGPNQQQHFTTKRSPQQMPVVIEHQHLSTNDSNRPSTSRGDLQRNSRVSLKMSGKFGNGTPNRKSFAGTSFEATWLAPEVFACLGNLDTHNNEDLPYEILGKNAADNGFDRPLSEISYDSCDPNSYDVMNASGVTNRFSAIPGAGGTLSKFHRSYSMGQGWCAANSQQQPQTIYKGLAPNVNDESQQLNKVVFRRRNNSTSEGDGSLLICYPSENLRKLVPDSILVTSAVQRLTTAEADKSSETIEPTQQNNELSSKCASQSEVERNNTLQNNKCGYVTASASKFDVIPLPNSSKSDACQAHTLLTRPAMYFMTQKHDLEKLRFAMKRSLRIATCRIYSLQALNWLLRSVTQRVCLHDLMWWFVSSLRIQSVEAAATAVSTAYEDTEPALEHPVSYTQISGQFSHVITQNLHVFLRSVADLTLFLPLGSPLQRIAIQCFGISFRQADHQFLHSAHVFGNISKILSKSDEQDETLAVSTMLPATGTSVTATASNVDQCAVDVAAAAVGFTAPHHDNEHNLFETINENVVGILAGAKVLFYTDLQGMFELTVSSRQAMVESLIDNSTETFWESDEDDRNRCKIIEISMTKLSYVCKMLLVHVDNSRDIQNKVLNISFYGGQSLGDTLLIKSVDVDQKACGWISSKMIDDSFTHFRLELNGPEGSLRVRQIKLLGLPIALTKFDDHILPNATPLAIGGGAVGSGPVSGVDVQLFKPNVKFMNAARIQQQICEAETLRVFRLITSQVFGKLICTQSAVVGVEASRSGVHYDSENKRASTLGMDSSANSMLADSLDLHTHMVGILFSRSKLSHLQKQVIVHIVYAIRREAQRSKEDWEIVNLTNCFKQMQAAAAATTSSTTSILDGKSEGANSDHQYRPPDTYCFEMLNLVLALSGSAVGRSYLSHQHGLLKDLLSLLHTGSDRVQRQVTALLRRILPEISPESFADILGVQRLPPVDYNIAHQNAASIEFDMNRLGLLDVLLAVIAKSMQLQVKLKMASNKPSALDRNPSFIRLCNSLDLSVYLLKPPPKEQAVREDFYVDSDEMGACGNTVAVDAFGVDKKSGASNQEMIAKKETKKNLNQRWFLNGTISAKQAESIIYLIRDLASGKLSQKWSQVTKAAVAESVLNLTRLDEIFRSPDNCIKTATLWLALASLCVLDREHVEKLSSGQWSKVSDTHPICSNHDDGITGAIIQCESCGSLCGDCDRFLHLSRKTRNHKRTVCKEEEEAIRVELHESCGRIKLFWLLALADSKTLKAMVEFRDGSHTIISGPIESVGRCRFCGITGNSGLLEIGNICCDAQCQEYAANSCMRTKPCGHPCGGVVNEKKCLPCLQHLCHARENELAEEFHEPKLTQDADDMCMICFEALSSAPAVHLECGHIFHYHCCKAVLEKRWNGPRITFGFSLCPICKADIQHPLLADVLEPINALKQDVKRKALMRIKYEGVVKESDARDLSNIAMDRYAYYVCFKCQKAYYGGEARCDAEIGEKYDPEELVCGGCSDVARAQMCPKHGTDFLEYKCRYCCAVAVFFCFGTTHFCDTCHDDFQRLTNIPKNKLPQCPAGAKATQLIGDECPLHVMHPPTGEEFALGCGVCRNAQTF